MLVYQRVHGKIGPLKIDSVCPLGDGSGFSYFLGLFQVIMANPDPEDLLVGGFNSLFFYFHPGSLGEDDPI